MKFHLFAAYIALATTASAQITTYTIPEKKEAPTTYAIVPYDSLTNISRANYKSLVGQKIQVLPTKPSLSATLYSGRPKSPTDYSKVVGPDYTNSNRPITNPSVLDNQLFNVIDYDSVYSDLGISSRLTDFFLIVSNDKFPGRYYLKVGWADDKKSGNKWEPGPGSFFNNNLIVDGYFKKLCSESKGGKLVYKDSFTLSPALYKLGDGSPISGVKENSIFDIKDVTYIKNNDYAALSYILSSPEYGVAFAPVYSSSYITYDKYLAEQKALKERLQALTRKYGSANAKLIMDGKVKLGFTKAMCEEAWGKPSDINKSSGSWGTSEQWVYGNGNYLYFKNGKLTSIDN